MRIRTKRGRLATRRGSAGRQRVLEIARASAVEEPALEQGEDLAPRERSRVGRAAVGLEHDDVVFERLVGAVERVLELVALEDHVLGPRLVRLAQVSVDGAPDRPHAALAPLDPEHDPLLPTDVVDARDHALGIATLSRAPPHATGIQSRLVAVFKNLFSFLFSRSGAEEHVARYVIREHQRGPSPDEILDDRYVQNRLTSEQQKRLLDRPEIIESIGKADL